jgi:hypothetical protein
MRNSCSWSLIYLLWDCYGAFMKCPEHTGSCYSSGDLWRFGKDSVSCSSPFSLKKICCLRIRFQIIPNCLDRDVGLSQERM